MNLIQTLHKNYTKLTTKIIQNYIQKVQKDHILYTIQEKTSNKHIHDKYISLA